MPPRLFVQPSFKAFAGSSYAHNPLAALSANQGKTSVRAGSTQGRRHDPYFVAQSKQRKAANLSRQKALAKEREGSVGHPVHSEPTPFIQELKATQQSSAGKLNYYLEPKDLNEALEYSQDLTTPLQNPDRDTVDPQLEKEAAERHAQEHLIAQEAINRITNLRNGNNKDRLRINFQKCIDTFGRHNTDKTLGPKPAAVTHDSATAYPEKTPRVGQDTGSPEVQVAILTAKIMNLSRHLESSKQDKHNKRNLRILVHKRQKLLRYLRRTERGGPRWQNLIETLGLSDASWKGEISM